MQEVKQDPLFAEFEAERKRLWAEYETKRDILRTEYEVKINRLKTEYEAKAIPFAAGMLIIEKYGQAMPKKNNNET